MPVCHFYFAGGEAWCRETPSICNYSRLKRVKKTLIKMIKRIGDVFKVVCDSFKAVCNAFQLLGVDVFKGHGFSQESELSCDAGRWIAPLTRPAFPIKGFV